MLRGGNTALQAVGVESTTPASLGAAPNVDPLGETYDSITPFRYGDDIAKFALCPVSPGLIARTGTAIDASGRPDAIQNRVYRLAAETEVGHGHVEGAAILDQVSGSSIRQRTPSGPSTYSVFARNA